ncbi:hypothetical protein ACQPWW_06855 [Micromonospora sp. CA-240977]|uniref:hypothetical protein n=1 Tax=Micromonospora sp. CA-240977 TaxID=3239957 RepID=UPI003D901F69
MEQRLTDADRMTLKTGAFGAVFLVSNADPGVLAVIRESIAASGALADASGAIKEALTTGPLPLLPRDSQLEIESVVLPALRQAVLILRDKSPQDVDAYRAVVLDAADRVARAHGGVTSTEAAAIDQVRSALAEPA